MSVSMQQIEKLQKQVSAILNEANVQPRTGRMVAGVGDIPADAPIASLIDHTLLKPQTTARQIEQLCLEAKEYRFASVCVNSVFVPLAAQMLQDSRVQVCTVVGFPLGACLPQVKAYEAQQAIAHGAQEVDMVLHVGAVKARDWVALHEDISEVATACHDLDVICKVILETALLSDEEKVMASQVALLAGADFVKTSTGFGGGGATIADVGLMRAVVGQAMGVKASGGVRSLSDARAMVAAGANRLGASAGVRIAQEEAGHAAEAEGNAGDY